MDQGFDDIFKEMPFFEGGLKDSVYNCNDGVWELLISATSPGMLARYEHKLEQNGYKRMRQNCYNGNRYAIYRDAEEQRDLFLSYTAHDCVSRIAASPCVALLPEKAEQTERVCDPLFSMLALGQLENGENNGAEAFGVSFVIRLEDGRFIVIDGGTNLPTEVDRLYRTLEKYHTGGEQIVIAAWLLTHPDGDHWGCFYGFSQKYAHQVKLEKILYNIYHESAENGMRASACGVGKRVHDVYVREIADHLDCDQLIKLHTGQRFFIGSVQLEVLYTHEDLYPAPLVYTNDSSVVVRLTIGGKTFLLPADIEGAGTAQLVAQCGEYLKSDYVQVIHHGWRGTTLPQIRFNQIYYQTFYELADAETALWSAQLDQKHYDLLTKADASVAGSVNWLKANVRQMLSTEDGDQTIMWK